MLFAVQHQRQKFRSLVKAKRTSGCVIKKPTGNQQNPCVSNSNAANSCFQEVHRLVKLLQSEVLHVASPISGAKWTEASVTPFKTPTPLFNP